MSCANADICTRARARAHTHTHTHTSYYLHALNAYTYKTITIVLLIAEGCWQWHLISSFRSVIGPPVNLKMLETHVYHGTEKRRNHGSARQAVNYVTSFLSEFNFRCDRRRCSESCRSTRSSMTRDVRVVTNGQKEELGGLQESWKYKLA
jgi:hypothetical protein